MAGRRFAGPRRRGAACRPGGADAEGVATIAGLATLDRAVDDLDDVRLDRMVRQAALQVQAREAPEGRPPPFELLEPILRPRQRIYRNSTSSRSNPN